MATVAVHFYTKDINMQLREWLQYRPVRLVFFPDDKLYTRLWYHELPS